MRVEEKFNKRMAPLIEVQTPQVDSGFGLELGVRVCLYPVVDSATVFDGSRTLSMHLTLLEALEFAQRLIAAAHSHLVADACIKQQTNC